MKTVEILRPTPSDSEMQENELTLFQRVNRFVNTYGHEGKIVQSMVETGSQRVMWQYESSRLLTPGVERIEKDGNKSYRVVEQFEKNPDPAYGIGQDGFSLRATAIDELGNLGEEETLFRIRKDEPIKNEDEVLELLQYMEQQLQSPRAEQ